MKHDPNLALQLLVADLSIKVAKLTERLARAEGRIDRFRRKSRAKPPPYEPRPMPAPPRVQRDESEEFARLADICAPIAAAAGVHVANLIARDRRCFVVVARQEAMRACHAAGFSASIIGRFLDGRDHATVAHGIHAAKARKIAANQAAFQADAKGKPANRRAPLHPRVYPAVEHHWTGGW